MILFINAKFINSCHNKIVTISNFTALTGDMVCSVSLKLELMVGHGDIDMIVNWI